MRFVSYLLEGDAALGLGLVDDDGITVRPVRLRGSERPVTDLVTLIDDWPAIRNELVAAEDTGPGGGGAADAADAGLRSRLLTGCVRPRAQRMTNNPPGGQGCDQSMAWISSPRSGIPGRRWSAYTVSAGPRTSTSTRPRRWPVRAVIRLDLPGHGRSPLPGGDPDSIGGWANHIEALLDSLGIATAALVGHSVVTLIATDFAATQPTRVSKLALLDALKTQPPQGKEATRTRAATVRERGMEAVADTIVGAATSERTQRDNPVAATFCGSCCSGSPPPMPRPARRSQPAPAAPS